MEVDKKREATASIRGYFYQLDATLLEILNADLNDSFVIEGIEDFDRYSDEGIIYGQVKYYAGKDLTEAVLRDPLYNLFVHFNNLEEAQRAGRKYLLYGHFSDVKLDTNELPVERFKLSVERFKSVMEYREKVKAADGTESCEKKSRLDGIATSDRLIEAFCENFSIKISPEFFEHRNLVIEAVRKNQNVSGFEAEGFHYPMAFDYIARLATEKDHNNRKVTLHKLQEQLKGTQAIHNRWLLREKDESEYAKHMKHLYFSLKNSTGSIRTFIIECSAATDGSVVYDQLREIGRKWSSATKRRIQNSERYAPFILLRGADKKLIVQVKKMLFDTGIVFVDGFPYRGSSFSLDHVCSQQTREHPIAIRFVDDVDQLLQVLNGIGRKSCHIYDFFLERPATQFSLDPKNRVYSIPISSISTITKII